MVLFFSEQSRQQPPQHQGGSNVYLRLCHQCGALEPKWGPCEGSPPPCTHCHSIFMEVADTPSEAMRLISLYAQHPNVRRGVEPSANTARLLFNRAIHAMPNFFTAWLNRNGQVWVADSNNGDDDEEDNNDDSDTLPSLCVHFSTDDVLSTLMTYPDGVPPAVVGVSDGKGTQHSNDTTCSVCLEDCAAPCNTGARVVEIHCGHFFHEKCLRPWIDGRHYRCPCCRHKMIYL